MHKITEVAIRNFKSCRETVLKLESFTALVGYNNAGKSNLLKCIDALVGGVSKSMLKQSRLNFDKIEKCE